MAKGYYSCLQACKAWRERLVVTAGLKTLGNVSATELYRHCLVNLFINNIVYSSKVFIILLSKNIQYDSIAKKKISIKGIGVCHE